MWCLNVFYYSQWSHVFEGCFCHCFFSLITGLIINNKTLFMQFKISVIFFLAGTIHLIMGQWLWLIRVKPRPPCLFTFPGLTHTAALYLGSRFLFKNSYFRHFKVLARRKCSVSTCFSKCISCLSHKMIPLIFRCPSKCIWSIPKVNRHLLKLSLGSSTVTFKAWLSST